MNGDIMIVPISGPMVGTVTYPTRLLLGHSSSITSLFVPNYRTDGIKKHLLSGSHDGAVKLWNSETGELLGSFFNHTMSVWTFVQAPLKPDGKLTYVLSLSRDGSIAILDINDALWYIFF